MATLRVTNLRGRTANVAPDLPDGANITGVCTATTFVGSLTGTATGLAGSPQITAGISTFTGLVSVDSGHINLDSGYSLQWDDSHERIEQSDGKIEFFTNNGEKMVLSGSNLEFPDDGKVTFGTGGDLEIYHTGSHSCIKDAGTGNLLVYSNNIAFNNAADTEAIARFNEDGTCELYHNGTKKVETSATGITVSGTVAATSYTGDGSALTGIEAGVTTTSQYNQSGVITINLGTGQGHEVTLAAGISTITVTGGTAGASHHLIITQPSSGITTVGFSTYFLWPSGSPPNLSRSSAAGETDMITFVVKQQTQTGTGVTQLLASAGIDYQ